MHCANIRSLEYGPWKIHVANFFLHHSFQNKRKHFFLLCHCLCNNSRTTVHSCCVESFAILEQSALSFNRSRLDISSASANETTFPCACLLHFCNRLFVVRQTRFLKLCYGHLHQHLLSSPVALRQCVFCPHLKAYFVDHHKFKLPTVLTGKWTKVFIVRMMMHFELVSTKD